MSHLFMSMSSELAVRPGRKLCGPKQPWILTVFLILTLGCGVRALGQSAYVFVPFNDLTGSPVHWVYKMNNNNPPQMCGTLNPSNGFPALPFIYLPEAGYGLTAGLHALGEDYPTATDGDAFAINDAAVVVGRIGDTTNGDIAFAWLPPTYPPDSIWWTWRVNGDPNLLIIDGQVPNTSPEARSINNIKPVDGYAEDHAGYFTGHIVGQGVWSPRNTAGNAFRLSTTPSPVDTHWLLEGTYGEGYSINDNEQALGVYVDTTTNGNVCYITPDVAHGGLLAGLGAWTTILTVPGSLPVYPWAINNMGEAVGQTMYAEGGTYQSWIYSNGQLNTSLQWTLFHINIHGVAVGGVNRFSAYYRWDSINGFQDLGAMSGQGQKGVQAFDINDNGVIACTAHGYIGLLYPDPPQLTSLTVDPADVVGGAGVTGTVTLSSAIPNGEPAITVPLSSDTPSVASVPTTVTISAGQSSATFAIATTSITADKVVTITATHGSDPAQAAALTVRAATPASVALVPSTVVGGNSSKGTVTLTGPAPSTGAVISLSSSDTTSATTPKSVKVLAGATTATFSVKTLGVAATATPLITATYHGVSQQATLTVNPAVLHSLSFSPNSVTGGTQTQLVVTLNGAAPPNGATVSLAYAGSTAALNNPPSTVVIPYGSKSVRVAVATNSVTVKTQIKATGTYTNPAGTSSSKSATLTVTP